MGSVDAKATPFGAYDAAFLAAVQKRWNDLLDQAQFARDGRGHVVLQFRLHQDGTISDMKMVENTSTEVLGVICVSAVLDPAPYERWPIEMRRLNAGPYRDIRFTFYYQ
jgi:hypothetical protein